jgi:Uma2 family endonuclease
MAETTQQEIYRHLRELRDHMVPIPGTTWGEISDGQIIMMMSPSRPHDRNAIRLRDQLTRQLTADLVATTSSDVEDIALGKLRRPDVLVLPDAAFDAETPEEESLGIDPRQVLLAVEIVSRSNPENDYHAKLRDYPAMGIPHYLIVDPRDGTCVHHWQLGTEDGTPVYAARLPYVFGDKVTVGEWTLDTGELQRYKPLPDES